MNTNNPNTIPVKYTSKAEDENTYGKIKLDLTHAKEYIKALEGNNAKLVQENRTLKEQNNSLTIERNSLLDFVHERDDKIRRLEDEIKEKDAQIEGLLPLRDTVRKQLKQIGDLRLEVKRLKEIEQKYNEELSEKQRIIELEKQNDPNLCPRCKQEVMLLQDRNEMHKRIKTKTTLRICPNCLNEKVVKIERQKWNWRGNKYKVLTQND